MARSQTKQKLQYSTSQLLNFSRDSYLERTSRPFYAIMFLLPFVLCYELGTMLVNTSELKHSQVRVVAFVWLQEWLRYLGYNGKLAWIAPPLVVILILLGLQLASRKQWYFQFGDVIPMVMECILLAVPLIVLSLFINNPSAATHSSEDLAAVVSRAGSLFGWGLQASTGGASSLLANIVTGIGAGIYEELVFRLILICVLMMIFQDLFGISHTKAIIGSIILSAALFSAHHHVVFIDGHFEKSSEFVMGAFIFRTVAGMYFAVLFAIRGFGITAGTHAFYDIIATLLNAVFFCA
ncbi:MAG: hypothetical protein K9N55_19860 [Phycisphaerae bacterium]|nr:hypothetical protein [Phycisphaerae bacterium]